MGITDVFGRDDRVELKVNELISYFRHEARTNARNEVLVNGLKAEIPSGYILTMIGEVEEGRKEVSEE